MGELCDLIEMECRICGSTAMVPEYLAGGVWCLQCGRWIGEHVRMKPAEWVTDEPHIVSGEDN